MPVACRKSHTSGVLQGSRIDPLFCCVFINDLIAVLEQYGVYAKVFADDLDLRIIGVCDVDKLQLNAVID